ncbi:hypothetical protein [Foetidibacter luteolus]|uniref:hypothetical protein n=1 Tax=Foetidibacter luteolus TaxID=2608880 RepID=UPI00129BA653|nr:hypothetical protein [Foetidibacter luteolus]
MSYELPAPGSHGITLQEAIGMTTLYRANREAILKDEYQGMDILVKSHTFNIQDFQPIFSNPSCAGLRIYYGMSEDLKVHAIVVGTDNEGNDIIPLQGGETSINTGGVILEDSKRCPPYCPPPCDLNP